jgi:hypothetical protein
MLFEEASELFEQAVEPAMSPEPWFERDRQEGKAFSTTNLEVWTPFADAVSVCLWGEAVSKSHCFRVAKKLSK